MKYQTPYLDYSLKIPANLLDSQRLNSRSLLVRSITVRYNGKSSWHQ